MGLSHAREDHADEKSSSFYRLIFLWNMAYNTSYQYMACNLFAYFLSRSAESEPESESPGVVVTSQESESGSESIKLHRLRLRNVLFESVT